MRRRLITGPILITLLVLGLWGDECLAGAAIPGLGGTFPPGSIILLVMALVSVLASRELAAILAARSVLASKRVTTFAALVGLGCWMVPVNAASTDAASAVATGAVLVLVVAIAFYSRHKTFEGVVAGAGGAVLSFVYLGLMFGFLLAIRRDQSAWVLLWVLLVTKSCDIGAYFTGKAIGRHKLIPWLSPGKTWEGLIGGVVFSAVVSWAGLWVLTRNGVTGMPPLLWAMLPGLVLGVVGQAGDLLESLFKRDAGIKDSGSTVPGMGGILDVIDSPLLVGPVAYWLLRAYEQAGFLDVPPVIGP